MAKKPNIIKTKDGQEIVLSEPCKKCHGGEFGHVSLFPPSEGGGLGLGPCPHCFHGEVITPAGRGVLRLIALDAKIKAERAAEREAAKRPVPASIVRLGHPFD